VTTRSLSPHLWNKSHRYTLKLIKGVRRKEDSIVAIEIKSQVWSTENKLTGADPLRILLIGHNATEILLIYDVLQEYPTHINLHLARDGEQAVRILKQSVVQLDLVILELNLPKMSGHEVLRHIWPCDVRVVVFASSPDEADARESLALGAQEYIRKPAELECYKRAVHAIIKKSEKRKRRSERKRLSERKHRSDLTHVQAAAT
jgi:DNA-binding NarL/FixJ family response regulator